MNIVNRLGELNFDFSRLPADIKGAMEMLSDLTDGTMSTQNQKADVLDYSIFKSIESLMPKDATVMVVRAELEAEKHTILNDGFSTKGLDENDVDDRVEAQEVIDSRAEEDAEAQELGMRSGGEVMEAEVDTLLLAPNGKPSNLTERQWHLVRTPEFKRFFGDWEKLAFAKLKDSAMDDVTLKSLSKNVSKAVDENGEPLVVYHGTRSRFHVFDRNKGGESNTLAKVGFWFTPKKRFAENWALEMWWGKDDAFIYGLFLNIKNPKIYISDFTKTYGDSYEKFRTDIYKIAGKTEGDANIGGLGMMLNNANETINQYRKLLNDEGYDGIILKETRFDKRVAGGLNDQFIALLPTQIKLSDGTNTTFDVSNPDIRYEKGGSTKLPINPNAKNEKLTQLELFNQVLEVKEEQGKRVKRPILTAEQVRVMASQLRESDLNPQLTMLSFGGGQDSFAMLYSIIHDPAFRKKYAPNDFFVAMSDTGNEHPYTYKAVKEAQALCKKHNIHFQFITNDQGFHTDGWMTLKDNMRRNKIILSAQMLKSCTGSLKISVVDKYMYYYMCSLYGFEWKPKTKKMWDAYGEKFNTKARILIGFAKDEETRMTNTIQSMKNPNVGKWKQEHIQFVYPLIEEGWNRESAQKVIKKHGTLMPPSNCMICFYQSEHEILWLWRNYPDEFNDWVELEKAKIEKYRLKFIKEGTPEKKNLGAYGAKLLPEKLKVAQEKFGHWTDEQLMDYKMSHGHCVNSTF